MWRGQFSSSEFGDLDAGVNVEEPWSKCKSPASKENRRDTEDTVQVHHKNEGGREHSFHT